MRPCADVWKWIDEEDWEWDNWKWIDEEVWDWNWE
jgi:hypothetical protein